MPQAVWGHMWQVKNALTPPRPNMFQYRKRYEVTCDPKTKSHASSAPLVSIPQAVWGHMWLILRPEAWVWTFTFQYRKRYEVTCDLILLCFETRRSFMDVYVSIPQAVWGHMWPDYVFSPRNIIVVSIPQAVWGHMWRARVKLPSVWISTFQYRKRYEVTCDMHERNTPSTDIRFQYRKRYEVTCDDTKNPSTHYG